MQIVRMDRIKENNFARVIILRWRFIISCPKCGYLLGEFHKKPQQSDGFSVFRCQCNHSPKMQPDDLNVLLPVGYKAELDENGDLVVRRLFDTLSL